MAFLGSYETHGEKAKWKLHYRRNKKKRISNVILQIPTHRITYRFELRFDIRFLVIEKCKLGAIYLINIMIDDILENLSRCELKFEMDRLLTYAEIEIAIKQINPGRAHGLYGLSVELSNMKSENLKHTDIYLITERWNESSLPNDRADGVLVCLYSGSSPPLEAVSHQPKQTSTCD